jgi:mono/diheme cytochrome c family protein
MNVHIMPATTRGATGLVKRLRFRLAGLLLAGLLLAGCSSEPQFKLNRVELLKIGYQQSAKNEPLPEERAQEVADVLGALFGTPNEPYFPEFGEDDAPPAPWAHWNLRRAAGPVSSDRAGTQVGLYREHCAHCHGISGDGAGPTAGYLSPYPRDFRLGKFKYKSTKLGKPPTDDDLRRLIRNGIPGTAMPSFRTLHEDELDALIDYVKYLTIRGQVELRLMAELPGLKPDEPLIDLQWRSEHPEATADAADEQLQNRLNDYQDQVALIVEDILFDVLDGWSRREPTPVGDPPAGLIGDSPEHAALVQRGRELFVGKANCAQCHGATGLGDGQTENYDDWTSQWVKGANVDPRDAEQCAPFIAAGAFPPRTIRPRNLRLRVYRGGDSYADLFRRIANGIEGTGMPDSSSLGESDLWALVAYVLHLPYEKIGSEALNQLTATPGR